MEQEEDWDIISVENIAEEFKIPQLADIIAYDKKVSVNMDHVSGWFEEDGERFLFMPVLEFHPMEDGSGFKLIHHHTDLDNDGNATASVYTFHKSDEEPGYRVTLDEESHIREEQVTLSEGEWDEELERFPPLGSSGYEDPFKVLDHNPTAE